MLLMYLYKYFSWDFISHTRFNSRRTLVFLPYLSASKWCSCVSCVHCTHLLQPHFTLVWLIMRSVFHIVLHPLLANHDHHFLAHSEVTTFLYHYSLFKHSTSQLTSLLEKMLLPCAISGESFSPSPSVPEPHRRFSGCKCCTATCPFAGYVCFSSSSPYSPAAWTRHHLATRVWPTPCELCNCAWYTPSLPWLYPWCLNGRAPEGNSLRAILLPVSVAFCQW